MLFTIERELRKCGANGVLGGIGGIRRDGAKQLQLPQEVTTTAAKQRMKAKSPTLAARQGPIEGFRGEPRRFLAGQIDQDSQVVKFHGAQSPGAVLRAAKPFLIQAAAEQQPRAMQADG